MWPRWTNLAAASLGFFGISHAAQSTVTIWVPTGTCPVPSPFPTFGSSTSTYIETTTDAFGNTITTTGTVVVPGGPSTLESYISTYPGTTTDSDGNTITANGTAVASTGPSTAPTSVLSYTTVLPDGSTVVTSTTSTKSGTSYSASLPSGVSQPSGTAIPGSARFPCPIALATDYTASDGASWQLFCNTDLYYNDLPATNASSLADCISSCDAYTPPDPDPIYNGQSCVAVTYTSELVSGANCYLKFDIQQVLYGSSPFDSAKLSNYKLPPSLSISVVSAQSSSTSSTTSGSAGPATATGSPSTGTTSTSTTTSVVSFSSYEPVNPCPVRPRKQNGTNL